MRLGRDRNEHVHGADARCPNGMAQRQRLPRTAAQPLVQMLQKARRELRLAACALHQPHELAKRSDRICLHEVGFQIQPTRARIAKAAR